MALNNKSVKTCALGLQGPVSLCSCVHLPVSSYFSMACCSVVSHWCKWCMFIILPCSQHALILVPTYEKFQHDCCGLVAAMVYVCFQISSLYATRWPVFPTCKQLILVSWYVAWSYAAIVGCSEWVMLCRCKVIPLKYGSFVSVAVQISARHNLFVSYRSIFLHKIGGISWLTLCRCWLYSCRMFILLVEYGLVHRGDCINCETCHFCFDPAFVLGAQSFTLLSL